MKKKTRRVRTAQAALTEKVSAPLPHVRRGFEQPALKYRKEIVTRSSPKPPYIKGAVAPSVPVALHELPLKRQQANREAMNLLADRTAAASTEKRPHHSAPFADSAHRTSPAAPLSTPAASGKPSVSCVVISPTRVFVAWDFPSGTEVRGTLSLRVEIGGNTQEQHSSRHYDIPLQRMSGGMFLSVHAGSALRMEVGISDARGVFHSQADTGEAVVTPEGRPRGGAGDSLLPEEHYQFGHSGRTGSR